MQQIFSNNLGNFCQQLEEAINNGMEIVYTNEAYPVQFHHGYSAWVKQKPVKAPEPEVVVDFNSISEIVEQAPVEEPVEKPVEELVEEPVEKPVEKSSKPQGKKRVVR